jgi:hypothetical protein
MAASCSLPREYALRQGYSRKPQMEISTRLKVLTAQLEILSSFLGVVVCENVMPADDTKEKNRIIRGYREPGIDAA